MQFELYKSQKKIARQLIEKGILKEFADGLAKVERQINRWKNGELNNRDAYHKTYIAIAKHDKHIASR